MIQPAKLPAALYAVHFILVKARYLVGEGADRDNLYRILDWAELLPALIARDDDTTDEFRETLVGLGQQCPEFAGIVTNFDRGVSWTCSANAEPAVA